MREPCQKQRKTTPDRFFCDMVRNCAYSWLEGYISPYNQQLDEEDEEDEEDEGYTPDDIDCMKTYKAFKKLDSKKQQAVIISVMKSLDMQGLKPDTIKTDKVVAFEVADTLTEPEYGFDVEELVKG